MKLIDETKPCKFCEHQKIELSPQKSQAFGFSWNLRIPVCSIYKFPPNKDGVIKSKSCDSVRQNGGLCGPKGKDFEPTAYSNLKRLMRNPESGQ